MGKFDVLVLLATYNGSKYLREQLDSLVYQRTTLNFQIIISDDMSTDGTIDILREYEKKFSFIRVIFNDSNKHGALENFAHLVKYVKNINIDTNYFMFCDQDDVWKVDKIELSYNEISKYQIGKPVLVYTSKDYVDSELNHINWNVRGEEVFDHTILIQNKTYGCTYIFNRLLFDKLEFNISKKFINYDHYVAIQSFIYGNIYFLDKKTILYRQHRNNVSGTVNKSLRKRISIFRKYKVVITTFLFLLDYCYNTLLSLEIKNKDVTDLYLARNKKYFFFICLKKKMFLNTFIANLQFYITLFLFNLGCINKV